MSLFKRVKADLIFFAVTRRLGPERPFGNSILDNFIARCSAMDRPRVLELGTKRSIPDRSTRRDAWIPNAGEYLGTDVEAGEDVDIVADAHQLADVVGEEQFDAIISCSTFEHFKYPHLAAHQVMKALKIGGLLFIQTHQTHALHGYPFDHFRFSREALEGLFGTRMGFHVIATDYEFPARIYAPQDPGMSAGKAFLNVRLFGEKTGKTPSEYLYELE